MDLSSSQHNKSKDDEKQHGGRPQDMEADAGKKEHEHEHEQGKEMSEHHSSHHDQGGNHNHGHGHGHREEHVGGREPADPREYLDIGSMGMTPGAFLEIRYKKATGRPYDEVERLISSEQMAKQQQQREEEAEASGRRENIGVIYEF